MDNDDATKKAAERLKAWKQKAKPSGVDAGTEKLLKNAMALNPQMKGGKKTQEFLDEVAKARKDGSEQRQAAAQPVVEAPRVSLLAVAPPKAEQALVPLVEQSQKWLASEDARISELETDARTRLSELPAERQTASNEAAQALAALLDKIDPSRSSPVTEAVMKSNEKFLKAIGFARG